jgi:hypothetical protein
MADEVEDTFDKLKAGVKAIAKIVTDPSKDLGYEYQKEKGKEQAGGLFANWRIRSKRSHVTGEDCFARTNSSQARQESRKYRRACMT